MPPHADRDVNSPVTSNSSTMAAIVNGNPGPSSSSSAFISHLFSYPIISDSISTFKSYPYGQKSIELADSGYNTFAKPVLPYLAKPYEYASPYVKKADELGDNALSKVDSTFPVVKTPTSELYDNATGLAFYPYRIGMEGKDYVFTTYSSECKKVGGDGLVTMGKAAITTSLIVSSDTLNWLSNMLSQKKAEAKEVVNEKIN